MAMLVLIGALTAGAIVAGRLARGLADALMRRLGIEARGDVHGDLYATAGTGSGRLSWGSGAVDGSVSGILVIAAPFILLAFLVR
ncbi:MAG: hypothetical protein AAFR52_17000 [Pseudomonadota bacterium]